MIVVEPSSQGESVRTVLIAAILIASLSRLAAADDVDEARRENQKAVGAFALGNYAEAASHYERAFALHPDAALLYNAAQSHRLAGNKPRALLLYENLERTFPGKTNKAEIDRHIADLRAAIAVESKAQHGDPKTTEKPSLDNPPRSAGTEPSPTAPPAATATTSTPPEATNAVTASPPPRDERPLTRKPWFWAVVGGSVVVVGLAVGLGVGLGLPPSTPTPSLGGVTVR
jgi:tetratricopeptide (TPR) repeat protein